MFLPQSLIAKFLNLFFQMELYTKEYYLVFRKKSHCTIKSISMALCKTSGRSLFFCSSDRKITILITSLANLKTRIINDDVPSKTVPTTSSKHLKKAKCKTLFSFQKLITILITKKCVDYAHSIYETFKKNEIGCW